MSYLSLNVRASISSGSLSGDGNNRIHRRNIIKQLNNIFYDRKKNKLCGNELRSIVSGRKLSYDWIENKYNSILLIVYDRVWKIDHKKWDDMADFLNELYVGDQIREKIIDVKQDTTYTVELEVFPVFDNDGPYKT